MRTRLLIALGIVVVATALPTRAMARGWTPYDRPAQYGVVKEADRSITMSDGVVLSADVLRPDKPGRYPVLVEQTPYNKSLVDGSNSFGATSYFAQRGYVVVVVDVRGTGSSGGQWDSFGTREQLDGPEVVKWARALPESDGRVGLLGPSYMAIMQLVTAAQHPPGLKAIFPFIPMADSYRDVTMSGGQIDSGFIPFWLGLVTAGGLVPPSYALDGNPQHLVQGLTTLAGHATGIAGFQASASVNVSTGGDLAYDGPFWKARSPLELVDKINVPAFVVGGLHDIFQRGEPLIYERLKRRVTTRLLIGPWTHVTAAEGQGLPGSGMPESLPQIQLRWFDHYLKRIDTRIGDIPKVTQYFWGDNRYETRPDWPDPKLAPSRIYLRSGRSLSRNAPTSREAPDAFVQQPVSGICTQSTGQWTAGLGSSIPCTNDNRLNQGGVKYTTAPFRRPLRVDGPLLARLWVKTTARDAVVSVRVSDIAPNGTPTELTAGWLAGSFRKVDGSRSRYVRGQLLQPWHPFTRASVESVPAGTPIPLAVEIFPTSAVIAPGHRLQVEVAPSDFPHSVPPAPQALASLGGVVQVLHDKQHPSYVALPTLGSRCDRRGCASLPVPDMTRG